MDAPLENTSDEYYYVDYYSYYSYTYYAYWYTDYFYYYRRHLLAGMIPFWMKSAQLLIRIAPP